MRDLPQGGENSTPGQYSKTPLRCDIYKQHQRSLHERSISFSSNGFKKRYLLRLFLYFFGGGCGVRRHHNFVSMVHLFALCFYEKGWHKY